MRRSRHLFRSVKNVLLIYTHFIEVNQSYRVPGKMWGRDS
jgi:hypothetical protein